MRSKVDGLEFEVGPMTRKANAISLEVLAIGPEVRPIRSEVFPFDLDSDAISAPASFSSPDVRQGDARTVL